MVTQTPPFGGKGAGTGPGTTAAGPGGQKTCRRGIAMLTPDVDKLLDEFVAQTKELLGDRLTGVYLHGSAVMGCFNPRKSDLDLIIVVDGSLPDEVKRAYMEMTVAASAAGPAKGIEMSIVRREVCRPFVYPTPYELHFSEGHRDWYSEDPEDYVQKMRGTDKDLAAHFTIINKRGRRLYGAPIREVFAEVPKEDYMDSIWFDVENALEEILSCPMYLTLNLGRVLAYQEAGLVLSKQEGGEWALRSLPAEYHPLIRDALREYTEDTEPVYDQALARRYAEYAIHRINGKEHTDV